MPETQWIVLGLAAAIAGGAIAAKLAGVELWKGLLVGGAAALAALLASFAPGIDRDLSMPIAALIASGIAGTTVGLSASRTAPILIGAAVPPLLGMMMLDLS
ncbi:MULTISPECIES: hypothetical protein [Rhizobiaceae]|jgi:hypothetical protein|uniref:Transmembrane protein n=1 Tax=Aliirhizobium cellulosilyticum TaxID=393664 RepID=A0A7W6UY71_9HYPH|nr:MULTISPECIES: hypothetical protein [Rhizobium/Agrobacterium group]MBB4346703.1 hypothetical protein [Rhizobium cellulosilyticum]MBB4410903.1 hypothetical protein [Rhizobium cellulosilyticum]MBB4445591.1 hypothetical protein [Rhizobium cellulosilyticum]MBO0139810.1 hypothetical protein [Agrobacterium sp. Ap1]